ncbi:MAG: hypothetical protein RLZZ142_990 [Verrucomicrobiota bacterium]
MGAMEGRETKEGREEVFVKPPRNPRRRSLAKTRTDHNPQIERQQVNRKAFLPISIFPASPPQGCNARTNGLPTQPGGVSIRKTSESVGTMSVIQNSSAYRPGRIGAPQNNTGMCVS